MKKFIIKIFFVLITSCIFFQSCSNSDEVTDNPVGGDAFRMQVVSIDLPNTTLSADEYHATMANVDITLNKGDEHKLLFMVPSNMTLGYQDLVIHDLNNLKVTYNVKDYILTESADATISPFQTNLATFQATTSGDTTVQNAVNSYNQMYSNASAEDKIKIATLYKVNKAVFDDIILNDYSDVSGRESQDAWALVVKHKKAIIAMTAGVIITLYGPTGGEKVAGLVLIAAGYYKAVGFGQALAAQTFTTVALQVGGVLGINDRNAHAPNAPTVLLNNDVATTLPLNTNDRTFITSDSNKTETGMTTFFTFFNKLNGYVSQINPVIQWVNDHVPFVNFSLLTPETVPTSSVPVANPMDAATFQKLTLSISDPALTLQTATLTSSGQLSLKVKITGSQTTVQSTLKYNYSDKFSTFSGSFPITVSIDNTQTVTIGTQTWMLKNLDVTTYRNGDPIPQVSDPTQWANLTTGAWCYYNNDPANGPVYGKLYNWYAVNDPRGLAPAGYHVPTDTEWTTLTTYLGGETVAGGKMKETGIAHWSSPNSGATNSSGFTGLPGGVRNYGGPFLSMGFAGICWSSSEKDATSAWTSYLYYSQVNVIRTDYLKIYGLSVRCIKD